MTSAVHPLVSSHWCLARSESRGRQLDASQMTNKMAEHLPILTLFCLKPFKSSSISPLEFDKPWKTFDWRQKRPLKEKLENFSVNNSDVRNIRILLAGQIGAGKSSFINSINSAFQEEIINEAIAGATADYVSFTKKLNTYEIRNERGEVLPFVISDIMGLEAETLSGLQVEDIISTILGHVMENYKFKEGKAITFEDEYYNHNPSVSDQTFCLVYIIAAETVNLIQPLLFEKLKIVRERISEKGIPQVIVMTKVDEACPLVKNDLRKIYTSKKIKNQMEKCSIEVGVPMNNIFPVKNYHDEIDTNDEVDVLILKAVDQIVRSAKGKVAKGALN
nr:interferon-induced protein 44-like [Misgurnus anguillicaudatus]